MTAIHFAVVLFGLGRIVKVAPFLLSKTEAATP